MIRNPILPGFNPDPSICRAGDDYYIATSTFEWYPGIRIHHSRDLENWQLVHRPLDRPELLDMVGVPDSCGVWAPCLTWQDGLFWLCYTLVSRFDGNFKDTHNYLTTCATIDGDWSAPVYLNSSGFDPSLFHDEDGRKWYLNMVWDHRPDRTSFRGIALQEYSVAEQKLLGKRNIIFGGTELGCTEGPHLYRFGGHYYLMTAEGGTGYDHAVTMARSRNIEGPYQVDPEGPVVCSRDHPDHPLQRTGHADLVVTPEGRIYMPHLASRPLPGTRRSPLGRETCLQELERNEAGWFRLRGGGHLAATEVEPPGYPYFAVQQDPETDHFMDGELHAMYQWLRSPTPERFLSLHERPGFLRLYGQESLGSHHYQSLIARRQLHFDFVTETVVEFEPEHFQQQAGLVLYYNASKFHYLYLSRDGETGKHLAVMSCGGDILLGATFPAYTERVALPDGAPVHLRATVSGAGLVFSWSLDGGEWIDWPARLDASLLSDEVGKSGSPQFTGNFVGLCCQDLAGTRAPADFAHFTYRGLDSANAAESD